MADKYGVIAGILIILFIVGIVYSLLDDPFHILRAAKKPRIPIPKRDPAKPLQILERRPSAGLAWSKAVYPEQYKQDNMKVAPFVGLNDFPNERFLDIGGRAYSRAFNENFSYTDPAKAPEVRIEYLAKAEALSGKIVGTGLKPNFAYQIKLRGMFTDRDAFERIGYTGRWRMPGRGTNYTDEHYEKYENKHLVEAYILFDYAITDPAGNLDKDIYLDSSLHVLWNYSTQRGPQPDDVTPGDHVREGGDRRLYAHPRADLSPQFVYAESQQHFGQRDIRKPIGQAFLPPGPYTAEVVLTEESFHGFGDCGFWATVMAADLRFEIVDKPKPPPVEWLPSEPVVENLSLADAIVEDVAIETQTETELTGESETGRPTIAFARGVQLPTGKRYLLAADVLSAGNHTWQIYISNDGEEFPEKPTYTIPSSGRKGWQYFEIEITSAAAGRPAFIGIVPSTSKGKIGIRNVSLRAIKEPEPALPKPAKTSKTE